MRLKRYLHLCLDAVVVVAQQFTAEAVGVLQLQTALGVEPVLQTTGEVGALPATDGRVTVVVVCREDDIDTLADGCRTGEVGATAADITVFAGQELAAQTDAATGGLTTQHSGNLCLATEADAVATIVVANSYTRVPGPGVDRVSATFLSRGTDAPFF